MIFMILVETHAIFKSLVLKILREQTDCSGYFLGGNIKHLINLVLAKDLNTNRYLLIPMNAQVNVRMPTNLLSKAESYAEKNGFSNVQDFIREVVREKLFDGPGISAKEFELVKKLADVSVRKGLLGTEEELFRKLRKR
jgi:predicted DNA binding CopG/RHH family protein